MFPEEPLTTQPKVSTPAAIVLTTKSGEVVGKAIPFRDNIYVAPDHLWQSVDNLYHDYRPIEVIVRDFQHDVLFLRSHKSFNQPVNWQLQPPGIGQNLQWFDGFQLHTVQVIAAKESFFSLDEITDLMSVNDILEPGDSGSPIFDQEGNIYGMLVGTDIDKNKAYFVRSDIVLDLAAEYLDLES